MVPARQETTQEMRPVPVDEMESAEAEEAEMTRFHRSMKILPGVKLHMGFRGLGLSIGPRGFHVGIDSRKVPYVSCGIPGTGIYAKWQIRGVNSRMKDLLG